MTRINVDCSKVKYDRGSETHQKFIQQEIEQFNLCRDELYRYDYRTELVVGLIGCAWFLGSMGTGSALFICLTYLGASHEFFGRPDYARRYQEQLENLYDLYTWCIESGGKAITSDKTFLNLAEIIFPLIKTSDLKKPLKDWNGVSEKFKELLLLNPLHRKSVLDDIKQSSSGFFSYFRRNKDSDEIVKAAVADEENSKNLAGTITQAYYAMPFSIYSRGTKRQQSWFESAQEWVQPVISKKLR